MWDNKKPDRPIPKEVADALEAMHIAARDAREIAERANTAIVVVREGKIVRITADELRKAGFK